VKSLFFSISTASYLEKQQKDLVIHCAGWKGTPNLEDTIFAGALIEILKNKDFTIVNDSALLAVNLYQLHKYDLLKAASQSAHAKRLSGFGVRNDIEFCLKIDEFDSVIKLQKNKLIAI
jgi:2-phosphosulfolactate phosphatase